MVSSLFSKLGVQLLVVVLCTTSIVAAVPYQPNAARHPTPSKRSVSPISPSKRYEARGAHPSGWKRYATPVNPNAAAPSKRHVAREPIPLGIRQPTPVEPMAPAPSKRSAKSASAKGSSDEQGALTIHNSDDTDFSSDFCPDTLSVCPVAPPGSVTSKPKSVQEWNNIGFECVDFKTDLGSCGDCFITPSTATIVTPSPEH
ncbi:hypothetical protein PILCRDRAFT_813928 [Piloderma croceum F 1598]|uniref:Uncharacterized protein n=1 Tax=Piloderma croceum (strain F 1598) TaxID=765440 RepID=A0A0C3GB25_PILCF|nr:hypothetical protein PILCRDRAFT_813928 [Piloderma croceum F 1598]